MNIFAVANANHVAFYIEGVNDPIPEGAFSVSEADWQEFLDHQATRRFVDGRLTTVELPTPPTPPAAPVITAKADLWRRCSDEEAADLYDAMQKAPLRARMVFDSALNVSSDDDLYPTLRGIIEGVVGKDRAAQILAAS